MDREPAGWEATPQSSQGDSVIRHKKATREAEQLLTRPRRSRARVIDISTAPCPQASEPGPGSRPGLWTVEQIRYLYKTHCKLERGSLQQTGFPAVLSAPNTDADRNKY